MLIQEPSRKITCGKLEGKALSWAIALRVEDGAADEYVLYEGAMSFNLIERGTKQAIVAQPTREMFIVLLFLVFLLDVLVNMNLSLL